MKLLLWAAVALALATAASAEFRIESITVGSEIRITILNDSEAGERPTRVDLKARENGEGAWRTIKTWHGDFAMAPGDRLCFAYSPNPGEVVDKALSLGRYDLQATVTGVTDATTTFEYDYDSAKP